MDDALSADRVPDPFLTFHTSNAKESRRIKGGEAMVSGKAMAGRCEESGTGAAKISALGDGLNFVNFRAAGRLLQQI